MNEENDLYQKVWNKEVKPADTLPASTIIPPPGKMLDLIFLSGAGICGEEDFSC
jgi:hypothetical protein